MSTILLFKSLLILLLLLNNPSASKTRGFSANLCVAAARPLEQNVPMYTNLKPKKGQGRGGSHVEACLPKGFRRSSAPSRYINYQPLGSTCFAGKVVNAP